MKREMAIFLSVVCGICIGMQPVVNSKLGQMATPKVAALHSLGTSCAIIAAFVMFSGEIKSYPKIFAAHPVYLIGGIFGITIVLSSIYIIPVIGPGLMVAIFVSIQLLTSAIIGHFGILGVARYPISMPRLFGMAFMIVGIRLMLRG